MLTTLFFRGVRGVRVDRGWWEGDALHLAVRTTQRAALCPLCGQRSRRVHSRYQRTLADLPCMGAIVTLHVRTRRFVCRLPGCRRRIFTERLPALMAPSARRTRRARAQVQHIGFDLGGRPGVRHARREGMPVSRRTLLRVLRATPLPTAGSVRVLGVDDWAQRRGRTYGTILVNLETHTVIDLLPDRTAETLAAWLRQHPEVEIISRDRAGAYADGSRQGAPQAIQVADRFHLLRNVTEAVGRFLARKQQALRQAAVPAAPAAQPDVALLTLITADEEHAAPRRRLTRHAQDHEDSRARRLARYEEVMALRAQGVRLRAIAAATGLCRTTVQRYVCADGFPESQPRQRRSPLLDPFIPYLRERWAAGCRNARHLHHDLRQRGYRGGYTHLAAYVRAWRPARTSARRAPGCLRTEEPPAVAASRLYSARQTLWLLLRPDEEVTPDERTYLTRLYQACPQAYLAQALAREFATLLREQDVPGFYAWLRRVEGCPIKELQAVARGMWLDKRAIEAAVTLEWSNGQVEGSVNKLKALKRAMFGRARFDLLKRRMLHAA